MAHVFNFLLYSALPFIFALGILVFIHELGHFLLAKLVGIRVERFSIGYPPRMFGKKVGDTDYCVSWVPLGGYVKLAGMIDESLDEATIKGEPWEFMSKPVYQRFLVILAGPVMNILLAILLIAGFAFFVGFGELIDKPIVGDVFEGKPAHTAGIRAGDEIISINGQPMTSWTTVVETIHNNTENAPIEIVWRAGDSTITRQITPQYDENARASLIGIGPSMLMQKYELGRSISYGFSITVKVTSEIFSVIGRLISREIKLKDSIAGPVSIFNMIGQSAKQGWENYLMLVAMISLNLGIFNLLPIPVLDGGHLVYLTIETIIRRPIPVKTKMIIQQIGIALLLILMVLVTINDIRR